MATSPYPCLFLSYSPIRIYMSMPHMLTYIYTTIFMNHSGSDPQYNQQSPTIHQLLSILSNFQSYLNDSLHLTWLTYMTHQMTHHLPSDSPK